MGKTQIIMVAPDESGRIEVELYGAKIELDRASFDAAGEVEFYQFGRKYIAKLEPAKSEKKTKHVKVEDFSEPAEVKVDARPAPAEEK